jgi:hypothetical protein
MDLSPDLIVRPYNEIVDDVLVAMLGGIVNEELIFDIREFSYPLSEPASAVRGVTGTATEGHYTFQQNIDWTFDSAQNAISWLDTGKKPDPGKDPVFYVDYFPRDRGASPLTDINVGSVTRTLSEAISRELAILYRQVNLTYQSAFIDLATGNSLDFVVAILGVVRKTADYAGLATFFRGDGEGQHHHPGSTRLSTLMATSCSRRHPSAPAQRGQVRIDVPRAAEAFKGEAGRVAANTITSLIIPIEGIERVNNFDPTVLGSADETDEELRLRAKAALRGLGQCTVDALMMAAREARAVNVEIMDPMFPPDDPTKHTSPGQVAMIVEIEPARFENVVSAVEAVRAAGISVTFIARYIFINPRLSVQLRRELTAAGKDQLKLDVIKALADFWLRWAAAQLSPAGRSTGLRPTRRPRWDAVKALGG